MLGEASRGVVEEGSPGPGVSYRVVLGGLSHHSILVSSRRGALGGGLLFLFGVWRG